MNPLTPYMLYIKVGVVIVVLALAFGGGYRLKSLQVAAQENKELKEAIKQRDELQAKYDKLSERVLLAVGQNDAIQEKIVERTYKEIEKPVYKDCVLPASGIALENEQRLQLNKQIVGDKARVE